MHDGTSQRLGADELNLEVSAEVEFDDLLALRGGRSGELAPVTSKRWLGTTPGWRSILLANSGATTIRTRDSSVWVAASTT
ncbi:MAG: hypothetical protein EXS13_12640 [Planctomycetes bacterium]|nr:hypothetical protein [Planctomycetota bacterium]